MGIGLSSDPGVPAKDEIVPRPPPRRVVYVPLWRPAMADMGAARGALCDYSYDATQSRARDTVDALLAYARSAPLGIAGPWTTGASTAFLATATMPDAAAARLAAALLARAIWTQQGLAIADDSLSRPNDARVLIGLVDMLWRVFDQLPGDADLASIVPVMCVGVECDPDVLRSAMRPLLTTAQTIEVANAVARYVHCTQLPPENDVAAYAADEVALAAHCDVMVRALVHARRRADVWLDAIPAYVVLFAFYWTRTLASGARQAGAMTLEAGARVCWERHIDRLVAFRWRRLLPRTVGAIRLALERQRARDMPMYEMPRPYYPRPRRVEFRTVEERELYGVARQWCSGHGIAEIEDDSDDGDV